MKFINEDPLSGMKNCTQELWNSIVPSFQPLDRLQKILGYPGQPDQLDHFRELATGIPQPLDLPENIVEIVCQVRDPKWLFEKIAECQPTVDHLNFDRIQKAAPGIIAAKRLEIAWATWHEYRNFDDVSDYERTVRELLHAGTSLGFLLQTMCEYYFCVGSCRNDFIDFSELFPVTDIWEEELVSNVQLLAASHIADYFRISAEGEFPFRPDLICRFHHLQRVLKMDLLDFEPETHAILENAAQFGTLRSILSKPELIENEPYIERFFREQWERHFADFLLPACPVDHEENDPDPAP